VPGPNGKFFLLLLLLSLRVIRQNQVVEQYW
jgi:hypothetical protein